MKTLQNLLNKSTVKENNNYSFIPEFEQIILSHTIGNYGKDKKALKSFLEDLQKGGCISGMIGEFVYHASTKEFYIKHIDDLEYFKADLEDQLGEPIRNRHNTMYYTFIVWLAFEEYCFDIYREVFES